MNDEVRRQRAALLWEQAMRTAAEENERMARQAVIDRCDKCPNPKQDHHRELTLPNGICLSVFCHRCASPTADCTALVQSHLLSEAPGVANRIVRWLAEQPELKAMGVTWFACLHWEADRLILTYRTPTQEEVVHALGAVPVDKFRSRVQEGNGTERGEEGSKESG